MDAWAQHAHAAVIRERTCPWSDHQLTPRLPFGKVGTRSPPLPPLASRPAPPSGPRSSVMSAVEVRGPPSVSRPRSPPRSRPFDSRNETIPPPPPMSRGPPPRGPGSRPGPGPGPGSRPGPGADPRAAEVSWRSGAQCFRTRWVGLTICSRPALLVRHHPNPLEVQTPLRLPRVDGVLVPPRHPKLRRLETGRHRPMGAVSRMMIDVNPSASMNRPRSHRAHSRLLSVLRLREIGMRFQHQHQHQHRHPSQHLAQ